MTVTEPPEGLRPMLEQAVSAYELARTAKLLAERDAAATREQALVALQAQQKAEVERAGERERSTVRGATGEQERLTQLLAQVEQVESAAKNLLERAGLAQVMGSPLKFDEVAAATRRDDETVAAAFANAQIAQVELRERLLALGLYSQQVHPSSACAILEALATVADSPVGEEAKRALPNAYEMLLIAEINAGRVSQAITRIAARLDATTTASAAQDAISRVLTKSLEANHHQASAWAAVALAPLRAVSAAQRQAMASRPECLTAVRSISGFIELSRRELFSDHAWQEAYTPWQIAVGNCFVAVFPTDDVGAVTFESSYVAKKKGYTGDISLEVFDVVSGATIERWSNCFLGLTGYERIAPVYEFSYRDERIVPGTSDVSVRSLTFAGNVRQNQMSLHDKRILLLDRNLRAFKVLSEPLAEIPTYTDLTPTDRDSMLRALATANGQSGARAATTADGLYAVVVEEDDTLRTLSRTLPRS